MKFGFTLAEVLITLGIVGVVASMTLPTLNNNVQKQTYEAGAKKAYNIVSNAVSMYMVDQGADDLSETPLYNNQDGLRAFVNKYFRVIIDCGNDYYSDNGASCFSKEIYSLDHSAKTTLNAHCMHIVTIADGMAFCFDSQTVTNISDGSGDSEDEVNVGDAIISSDTPLTIEVDINGPKGPNASGRDLFYMAVNRNGVVISPPNSCVTTTQEGRNACVAKYTKTAQPMTIGLLQYYGWKMKY